MKTLKNHSEKNEHMSQLTHVQNHAYTKKSMCAYVRDIRQLLNPDYLRCLKVEWDRTSNELTHENQKLKHSHWLKSLHTHLPNYCIYFVAWYCLMLFNKQYYY